MCILSLLGNSSAKGRFRGEYTAVEQLLDPSPSIRFVSYQRKANHFFQELVDYLFFCFFPFFARHSIANRPTSALSHSNQMLTDLAVSSVSSPSGMLATAEAIIPHHEFKQHKTP
jgi:hypothetical protein